ncbi:MAG: (2Fe-2S)-binding protein [Clostridia bacterium]|nr:(2Fe-2S)-binding protein [Clostridia bacterium]
MCLRFRTKPIGFCASCAH